MATLKSWFSALETWVGASPKAAASTILVLAVVSLALLLFK